MPPAVAGKLRRIVSFPSGHGTGRRVADGAGLESAQADRRSQGPLSLTVTANWRLTFRIDREEMEIVDLDYED